MPSVILETHLSPELIDAPLPPVPWHDLDFVLLLDLALIQQQLGVASVPFLANLILLLDLSGSGSLLVDLPFEHFNHCGLEFLYHDFVHLGQLH